MENVSASKVTELLDCAAYYTLMKLPLPSNRDAIIHNMVDEEFIREMDNGNFVITNMGALLLAKDLNVFAHLKRKAIRVIKYKGMVKQMLSENRYLRRDMQFSLMILQIIL